MQERVLPDSCIIENNSVIGAGRLVLRNFFRGWPNFILNHISIKKRYCWYLLIKNTRIKIMLKRKFLIYN